jgi:hypothetical protein
MALQPDVLAPIPSHAGRRFLKTNLAQNRNSFTRESIGGFYVACYVGFP